MADLLLTAGSSVQPHQKTPLQKTSHDFQLSLVAFQRAQQVSAERQRAVVEGVKIAVEEDESRCAWMVCGKLSILKHSEAAEWKRLLHQDNGRHKCFSRESA